ncbi:MAG: pseudouridine synthase [Cyanobacteria bacterium SZAS LIN-5]|nr:pseudouridine synthase [Cyanobacteria bacterium SZAS LIN-5]RTL39910.1 MAG: pseudouridine synthase [Candidatus Melainabacteria bacterium]
MLSQFSETEDESKETLALCHLPKEVYPVGRLDYDSEGLLLLTDDSRMNSRLLSPVNAHERTYWAQVENIPSAEQLRQLSRGVVIENKKTLPAHAELLDFEPVLPERNPPIRFRKNIPTAWLSLTLIEGRNRQVRKMTAAINCPTLRLIRQSIGRLDLFELDLEPGQWCDLDDDQLARVFEKVHKLG